MPLSPVMEEKLLRLIMSGKFDDRLYTNKTTSWACCKEITSSIFEKSGVTERRARLVYGYLHYNRAKVMNLPRTTDSAIIDVLLCPNRSDAFEQSLLKYLPLFHNELKRGNLGIASVRTLLAMIHGRKVAKKKVKYCLGYLHHKRQYLLEKLVAVHASKPGRHKPKLGGKMGLAAGETSEAVKVIPEEDHLVEYLEGSNNHASNSNELVTQFGGEMCQHNEDKGKWSIDISADALKDEAFDSEYMIPDDFSQSQSVALTNDTISTGTRMPHSEISEFYPSEEQELKINGDTRLIDELDLLEQKPFHNEYMIPDDFSQTQLTTLTNDTIQARINMLYSELVELKQQRHKHQLERQRIQDTLDKLFTQEMRKDQELQVLRKRLN